MANRTMQSAGMAAANFLAKLNLGLSFQRSARRRPVFENIRRIKSQVESAMTPLDAVQIHYAAAAVAKVPGAAAEVGVFRGASSRIILDALPTKTLHLCDTFEGLPSAQDGYAAGEFAGSLESVKAYLNNPHTVFHKGYFPRDTGHELENETFAFVHLDMDYYDGTLSALEFFWPRMSPGGIALTHDYDFLPGPTKAFDEFFAHRPEPVIELPGAQALVVKLS